MFQAKKGSKTTRLRETGALLQAGLEVDLTGAARQRARLTEESQQQHSQGVAKHTRPLSTETGSSKRRLDENLRLKLLPRKLLHWASTVSMFIRARQMRTDVLLFLRSR